MYQEVEVTFVNVARPYGDTSLLPCEPTPARYRVSVATVTFTLVNAAVVMVIVDPTGNGVTALVGMVMLALAV